MKQKYSPKENSRDWCNRSFLDPALNVGTLRQELLRWFDRKQRTFPWRQTDNAFHLLLSELMLRRTRADQVIAVYLEFIQKYPDPETLASASLHTLERDLYSLGLAWRVPAFKEVAQALVEDHQGVVPDNYKELTALPGVGDYVASAICCFAFGQPIAIVDVNTVRIAGRLFDVDVHAESRRNKQIRQLITSLLDTQQPRKFNYALLDLAALICTSRKPACEICPLVRFCMMGQREINERAT